MEDGSPWLQPGMHCVPGEGNEEMMLERWAGSPVLGLPSVHCGEPEVFREESDKIYVMIDPGAEKKFVNSYFLSVAFILR